jgi:oligosaccharide translocation protein RFT1
VIIISLLLIVFVIPYSRFLLNIYGGSNLSDGSGPTLRHLYCIYLLFLAINGITEAFSQATMSIKQLEYYKNLIAIFAVIYLGIFYILIKLIGVNGLIIANCLNMSARIITNSYFHGVQWSKPFQFSLFICYYSEKWLTNPLIHFSLGVVLGLGMLLLTWREEKEMNRLNREKKSFFYSISDVI